MIMISMSSPVAITSIYPWADFMPGCGTGELMCIIKFNMQVSAFEIKNITLVNGKGNEYVHNINVVDGYRYEQRGNEVVIRCGPQWLRTQVVAKVTVDYGGSEYILTSQPKSITETC
jgi:hypothetical protein